MFRYCEDEFLEFADADLDLANLGFAVGNECLLVLELLWRNLPVDIVQLE